MSVLTLNLIGLTTDTESARTVVVPTSRDKINIRAIDQEEPRMGCIVEVEFSHRPVQPNPQLDLATQINAIQMSQEETVRKFVAGIETLGESLRDIEAVTCHVDDTEAREKLRFRSQSIRRGFFLALQKLLNDTA